MIRRTSLHLDMNLVRDARKILGTEGTTDTIHGALSEIVRRERLRQLAEQAFPDLNSKALETLRRARTPSKAR